MRRAVIVTNEAQPHHVSFGGAFAEGLRKHGWITRTSTSYQPCDLLVLWGVKRRHDIAQQLHAGGEVCILERGYAGDRFAWASVSFGGGLNGRARFVVPPSHGPERWERHFGHLMRPWCKPNGTIAVIMGQVPGDQSIKHVNIGNWYRTAAAALRAEGWQPRFRSHPGNRGVQDFAGLQTWKGSLEDTLAVASLVVTFNSNSGVDAVLAGVPTVAMDEGSMVRDVAAHDIGVVTPDRSAWAARLAYCQWTREEMVDGSCQEAVGLS